MRLILALLLSFFAACGGSGFVERIEISNDTAYPAHVQVRGEGTGWVDLMTVAPGSSHEIEEVLDRGPTWTFRFSYGYHEPVTTSFPRRELIDSRWRVEVPERFEAMLRSEGVPPAP